MSFLEKCRKTKDESRSSKPTTEKHKVKTAAATINRDVFRLFKTNEVTKNRKSNGPNEIITYSFSSSPIFTIWVIIPRK